MDIAKNRARYTLQIAYGAVLTIVTKDSRGGCLARSQEVPPLEDASGSNR